MNVAGDCADCDTYHLVLANPPYYANFQIATRFLLAGRPALQPGGHILLVTKSAEWYVENMHTWYDDVQIYEAKGYYLVSGRKPN